MIQVYIAFECVFLYMFHVITYSRPRQRKKSRSFDRNLHCIILFDKVPKGKNIDVSLSRLDILLKTFIHLCCKGPSNLKRTSSPCLQSPCENNGRCYHTSEGYQCQCPEGYSGRRCESKFNTALVSYIQA